MDKKYISYIGTGVIIVIIIILVLVNIKKTEAPSEVNPITDTTKTTQENTTNAQESTTNTDKAISLWEKFSKGEKISMKCEYETEQDGGKVNQVIYISTPKIRIDMNLTHASGESISHMIMDNEYTYIWGNQGEPMKMKNVENNEESTNENTEEETPEQDVKDSLDSIPYDKCSEWITDTSVFELPAGIKFTDMEELMKKMPTQEDIQKMMDQSK
ncbi:MAG: hypothetical protein PHN31_00885 [Candidatus Gracilibacteria bacterium]|nr:hypothetical protein [Candidatus Gracilibacteria bacterium]